MADSSKGALVPISFWAVGRFAETSQVAIRLNDLPPILMSAETAGEIAAALKIEIEAVSHAPAVARSVRSPMQSLKSSRNSRR